MSVRTVIMVFHIKYCFDGKLFNLRSLQAQTKVQKEMPRSQSTANPRHQKKELYEINNNKTNVTYETTTGSSKEVPLLKRNLLGTASRKNY